MQPSPAQMAHMVFIQAIPNELSQFNCTSHMLMVLIHLDGRLNLTAVAKKAGLPIKDAVNAAAQLSAINIIETTSNGSGHLNADFVNYMKNQLSMVVGPIAEILIEDAAKDLGHTIEAFPAFQAADLVEILAKDINQKDKRITFKQNMVARIKQG
jgi:hypothetical protein